jgi:hypothetical protein
VNARPVAERAENGRDVGGNAVLDVLKVGKAPDDDPFTTLQVLGPVSCSRLASVMNESTFVGRNCFSESNCMTGW